MLNDESLAEIERECAKYPAERRQSALMAALRIAQDEHRWLNDELIEHVAEMLGLVLRRFEQPGRLAPVDVLPAHLHDLTGAHAGQVEQLHRGSNGRRQVGEHRFDVLGRHFGHAGGLPRFGPTLLQRSDRA